MLRRQMRLRSSSTRRPALPDAAHVIVPIAVPFFARVYVLDAVAGTPATAAPDAPEGNVQPRGDTNSHTISLFCDSPST
jgi:hypothetical protein